MSWTGQCLKAYYCAGGVLWVFCGTSILFLPRSLSAFMYVISVFIGIANTLMTVWYGMVLCSLDHALCGGIVWLKCFMWWNCVVKVYIWQ